MFNVISDKGYDIDVSFGGCRLSRDRVVYARPRRIRRIAGTNGTGAFLLFVSDMFVSSRAGRVLTRCTLSLAPFGVASRRHFRLRRLFTVVLREVGSSKGGGSGCVVRGLTHTTMKVVARAVRKVVQRRSGGGERVRVALTFGRLLSGRLRMRGEVSRCTGSLRVSPMCLGRTVGDVTKVDMDGCVRVRLVLETGQVLVCASLGVGRVTVGLNFSSCTCFAHLFAGTANLDPASCEGGCLR